MALPPPTWPVLHQTGLGHRLYQGFAAVVGAFFTAVCAGALFAGVQGLWLGTRHASVSLIFSLVAGLLFGAVMLWVSIGSLLDLLGATVVLDGPIEALRETRRSRGPSSAVFVRVQGLEVQLPARVAAQLAVGQPLWVKAGRFGREATLVCSPRG